MIKIMIVDDHAIVREGLKQIVRQTDDMEVVAEAENGSDMLKILQEKTFDIVLLDISIPGRNGIDYLKDVKQLKPDLPVLILSMHPEEQFAMRALTAGAAGYLTKKSASRELIAAIRKVADGRKYVSPEFADKILMELDKDAEKPPYKRLSNREFEVMRRIASGETISEIAEGLNLSVQTISTYRSRILDKMNLKTSAELTYYAIKNGLVE
jgi:two-component system, NarL family, invasion response regulator UvrY